MAFRLPTTVPRSHFIVGYEDLLQEPVGGCRTLFTQLEFPIEDSHLERAVALSSYENIKRMSEETGQTHGMAAPSEFTGHFLRDGGARQFTREPGPETVKQARKLVEESGIQVAW